MDMIEARLRLVELYTNDCYSPLEVLRLAQAAARFVEHGDVPAPAVVPIKPAPDPVPKSDGRMLPPPFGAPQG